MKKLYLDFDGTVVEHNFPGIGRCNFGCMEVIKKLQDAGFEVILNTVRSEIEDKSSLNRALKYLNEDAWMFVKDLSHPYFALQPIKSTENKIHPHPFDINTVLESGLLYIDDIATNIPLKPCKMIPGNMVDWDALDTIFQENGLYNI